MDSLDLRIKAMESAHETNHEKLGAMLEKEAARVDEVLRKFEEEKEETKKICKDLIDGAYLAPPRKPLHTEASFYRNTITPGSDRQTNVCRG